MRRLHLDTRPLRRRDFRNLWVGQMVSTIGADPRYRGTGLQLQVELARAIGDTATARSAAERFNATRRPPMAGAGGGPLLRRLRRLSRALVH